MKKKSTVTMTIAALAAIGVTSIATLTHDNTPQAVDVPVASMSAFEAEHTASSISRSGDRGDLPEQDIRSMKQYDITLAIRGAEPKVITVDKGTTVADALSIAGVVMEQDDKVDVPVATKVTSDINVVITNEKTRTWTEERKIEQPDAVYVQDGSIPKGENVVLRDGVPGISKVTLSIRVVNGKDVGEPTVLSSEVVQEALAKKVAVGTYVAPAPKPTVQTQAPAPQQTKTQPAVAPVAPPLAVSGLDLSNAAMWDRIAKCESSGRWNVNTGNGYYGGLQFDYGTWLSAGGGQFAQRADLATREQQITIANRLYAQRGLQPWGCAHAA